MTRADRGSASLWVLVCALAVLAAGYLVAVRTSVVLLRHRAQAAADLAALAAAAQFGTGQAVCARASALAQQNGASVISCRASPDPGRRSGVVSVVVAVSGDVAVVGAIRATARAKAGRLALNR